MTVKVITTLHEDGYKLYGKNLNTWSKFFPQDWTLEYYAENHTPDLDARFTVKDFNKSCPAWDEFYNHVKLQTVDLTDKKKINWYRKALRWSFKMFVLVDALEHTSKKYIIWLDSDVVAVKSPETNWIKKNLNNQCFAGKLEKINGQSHIESGILLFDTTHYDITKCTDWIKEGYFNKKIFLENKAWDGFWLAKLINQNISWNNSNMFSRDSFLIHCVGDEKFTNDYSGRSGRSQNNELI
jgi:hypothetical protein